MTQWGGAGGAGVGLWPLLVLLLGLVVVAVLVASVYLLWLEGEQADPDRAMELLRERYARGDLTDEEFESRSERLARTDDTGPSATS